MTYPHYYAINSIYNTLLQRDVDDDGLRVYNRFLRTHSEEELQEVIMHSDEYVKKRAQREPNGFDWSFYVAFHNLDIRTRADAVNHYIAHGENENRIYSTDQLHIPPGINGLDAHSIESIRNLTTHRKCVSIDRGVPPSYHKQSSLDHTVGEPARIPVPVTTIPRLIHKIYLNGASVPPDIDSIAVESWRRHMPEYTIIVYTQESSLTFLQDNFPSSFVKVFNELIPYAFKADFLRACILFKLGGIYSDLKQLLLEPMTITDDIDCILVQDRELDWTDENTRQPYQNCLIAVRPNHPYMDAYINLILHNVQHCLYGNSAIDVTGPVTLLRCVVAVRKNWEAYDPNKERILHFFQDVSTETDTSVNNIDSYAIKYETFYIGKALGVKNAIIKHKYDSAAGGNWKCVPNNNNYGHCWAGCAVFLRDISSSYSINAGAYR